MKRCIFAVNFRGRLSCWHWELTYWRANAFRPRVGLKAFAISAHQIKQYAQRLSRESVPTWHSHSDVTCSHIPETLLKQNDKEWLESRAKQDIPATFLFGGNNWIIWFFWWHPHSSFQTTESSDFSDGIRVFLYKQHVQLGTTGTTFIMGIRLQLLTSADSGAQNQSIMMDRLRLMRLRQVLKTTSNSFKYQQRIAIKRHALRCVTF